MLKLAGQQSMLTFLLPDDNVVSLGSHGNVFDPSSLVDMIVVSPEGVAHHV